MMKNEFTEIIETLEIEDSQLENMRRKIVKACSNPESTNQVILLFESRNANLCICADTFKHKPICSVNYEPYCLFFRAYANYCKGGYQEVLELYHYMYYLLLMYLKLNQIRKKMMKNKHHTTWVKKIIFYFFLL